MTDGSGDSAARCAQEFSELVGAVYDTVLDRATWPDVLKKLTLFIEGAASAVFWQDAANGRGDVYFDDGGVPIHYRESYFNRYARLDPVTTPRSFAPVEEPIATADLVAYDEFLRSRFYREWAEPQGLVDFISVTLEKTAGKAAIFGVFRHARHGLADEAARRRMGLLAPHIRRAVLISKVVDFEQDQAAMLGQTLDGLRAAVMLVDEDGRILHANVAGHALLAQGKVVRAAGGVLAASTPRADRRLRQIFRAAADGDEALGGKGIALSLGSPGERYVAHALPLRSRARWRAGRPHAAAAAIFIHKASLEAPAPPPAIAEAYGLTMAELRVLFAIVEVGGAPEVAETLGIAASTVRTHLGRVYEKTGVSRQADLVKLVAGYSSALAG